MLCATTSLSAQSRLVSRLEELDRVAIWVHQQDLLAARSDFHLIAKIKSRRLQGFDRGRQVSDFKDDPIPSARLLTMSIRHWTGARCARAAEDEFEIGV